MSAERRLLPWRHGIVTVEARGAMIGPTVFILDDGRMIAPLWLAPWWNERHEGLDAMTAALRGEWPCVPFGYPQPGEGMAPGWRAALASDADWPHDPPHGPGSHALWRFESAAGADHVALAVDYPVDHDIAGLRRVIRPDPDAPALDFSLEITARRATALPVALHFCFRLGPRPGDTRLIPGAFARGWTHPGEIEPGRFAVAKGAGFADLAAVPAAAGGTLDLTRLPITTPAEEVLQLTDSEGRFAVAHDGEGWRADLSWPADALPSTLLWLSNRGRQGAPWNGRTLALGVEPAATAFGLSVPACRGANPIADSGTATTLTLAAGETRRIDYRLSVSGLAVAGE